MSARARATARGRAAACGAHMPFHQVNRGGAGVHFLLATLIDVIKVVRVVGISLIKAASE